MHVTDKVTILQTDVFSTWYIFYSSLYIKISIFVTEFDLLLNHIC